MLITVEPKDWMMYSVFLYFSDQRRDAEDAPVKRYLAENGLEPKRQFRKQVDDTDFDVMYFGGCYLGRGHLQAITRLQEGVVERELLADEIRNQLTGAGNYVPDETVDTLVEKLRGNTTFETDEQGKIVARLDASVTLTSYDQLQK